MRISNRARLALDVGLFIALMVAFFPKATGIPVHEWLAALIIVPTLFHLVINWDWVKHTCARILEKLKTMSAINLLVDVALFLSAVTVMLSGFMVSQSIAGALGLTVVPSAAWHVAHSLSAKFSVLFMTVHLALHGRWIARVARGWLESALGVPPVAPKSVAIPTRNYR